MEKLNFYDFQPKLANFHDEVIRGLSQPQKGIAPKFFYDKRGSELFDRICEVEEYYPTRTEVSLLQQYSSDIAQLVGENALLIEYGSGNSSKVRILLDAFTKPAAYMPIDISKEHMIQATEDLAQSYPNLDIVAVCADYTQDFSLPATQARKRFIFFPGSTIGNLEPASAVNLLQKACQKLTSGDAMLVGADLKKDPKRLEAAYNDSEGVTAAFNLNLLERINRELQGNFDLNSFKHYAFYNPEFGRIEMHLKSLKDQKVQIGDREFSFAEGETIHTESSYKYSQEEFQELAQKAGFLPTQVWMDSEQLFSLYYLSVP